MIGPLYLILLSLRPKQWIKNLFIFPALLFSKHLFDPEVLLTAVAAFIIFCFLSGSVYLFNDICDREEDRRHPEKSKRPIASGLLRLGAAKTAMVIFALASLGAALCVNLNFALVGFGYLAVQITYSLFLRQMVLLDVFAIASGFFLRVYAGAQAIGVPISSWLLLCTIFLSLFLALGKRRNEMMLLGKEPAGQRRVLKRYDLWLLDQMVSVVTSGTVLSYSLYTLSPETVERFQTRNLWLTIPLVLFGVFRYLLLVYQNQEGGSPENILVTDSPLMATVLLYLLVVVAVLYF